MAYREYSFEREPFLPELNVEMRGREREWCSIREFLSESFQGNRIRALLILADYGYGKTFVLNKIRESVNDPKSDIKGAKKTLTASVVLAETEPASSISYEYVTKIMYSIGEKELKRIAKKVPEKTLESCSPSFKILMSALKEEKGEAFKWVVGEDLDSQEKKNIGVRRRLYSSESLKILLDFLKVMKRAGYDNLLVLIDEFEYAINVYSESKLTQLFHTFKNIYDRFTSEGGSRVFAKHIQIIGTTPRGWDVVTDLEAKLRRTTGGGGLTPWLERMKFERDRVTLGPIDDKSARMMILDRIKKERMKFASVGYETFPFVHPSFFDKIVEISKGIPRNLLDFSEIVLEEAARRKLREINGDDALRILREFDLVKS